MSAKGRQSENDSPGSSRPARVATCSGRSLLATPGGAAELGRAIGDPPVVEALATSERGGAAELGRAIGDPPVVEALATSERGGAAELWRAIGVLGNGALAGLPPEALAGLQRALATSGFVREALVPAGRLWEDAYARAWHGLRADARWQCRAIEVLLENRRGEAVRAALRNHLVVERLRIAFDAALAPPTERAPLHQYSALIEGLLCAVWGFARDQFLRQRSALMGRRNLPRASLLAFGSLARGSLAPDEAPRVAYVYDEAAQPSGARRTPRAETMELAETVAALLAEVGIALLGPGVRPLGPGKATGPAVVSFGALLLSCESFGEAEGRVALMASRPIAGDRELPQALCRETEAMLFPRALDTGLLHDLTRLARRELARLEAVASAAPARASASAARSAFETLLAVRQVVDGGQRPERRCVAIEDMLVGFTSDPALVDAWTLLARAATLLPAAPPAPTLVAEPAAAEPLLPRFGSVFATLTRTLSPTGAQDAASRVEGDADAERILAAIDAGQGGVPGLAALGLRDLEGSARLLCRLCGGGPGFGWGRERRALRAVAPLLFSELARTPDPDGALRGLASWLEASQAPVAYLRLFHDRPEALRIVLHVFGTSARLGEVLLRGPGLLEEILAHGATSERGVAEIEAEMRAESSRADSTAAGLAGVRRVRARELLSIGLAQLCDPAARPRLGGSAWLAALAVADVRVALDLATAHVCGVRQTAAIPHDLTVVALGRLGSGELDFGSDLDLIFVAAGTSNDSQTIDFLTAVAQRTIAILQDGAAEAVAWRVDTRLRPHGEQGPLVTSLATLERHHRQGAEIWERQAILKARPIAGDPELARRVALAFEGIAYGRPVRGEEVREMDRVRRRYEHELVDESSGRLDLKRGPGGLLDVEFAVQALQMRHGSATPEVRRRAIVPAIEALAAAGVLATDDAQRLRAGYVLLRRFEAARRGGAGQQAAEVDAGDPQLEAEAVARRLGRDGPDAARQLLDRCQEQRLLIRECYERLIRLASDPSVEAGALPDPPASR